MKETLLLKPNEIEKAAEIIKSGGVVAFPTETVYGLGADALNDNAIKKIFRAKNRPIDNPLIVHICSIEQLDSLVEKVPEKAIKLAEKFWPGPLTMIMKKKQVVPNSVSAGFDSVGIRMPKNKIALDLIKLSGKPIAAPSANLSGKPSPTHHSHVIEDLNGKIDAIILAGYVKIGIESTVIDMTKEVPIILRPGVITLRMIQNQIGKAELFNGEFSSKPASPGMKYKHYSPNAKVILVKYSKNQNERTKELIELYKDKNRILILSIRDLDLNYKDKEKNNKIKNINLGKNLLNMTNKIFSLFREADKENYDLIIVQGPKEIGKGIALNNRLEKAATEIVK